MTTFGVFGTITITVYTEVEAATEDDAREIAGERELSGMVHRPCTEESSEAWTCNELDGGEPTIVEVCEHSEDGS